MTTKIDIANIMNNVTIKLMPKKNVGGRVYREYLDLAAVPCIVIAAREEEYMVGYFTDLGLKEIGIDADELFESAIRNIKDPVIKSIVNVLSEMMEIYESPDDETDRYALVVTNTKRFLGASYLMKPDTFKEVADYFESDLVIFPSSIHELIVSPSFFADDMEENNNLVARINSTEVRPDEVLSNHAYRYFRDTNTIGMV